MVEWDGHERRKEDRRITEHCALHSILWDHHDKDTTSHRQTVCGKIARVEREVERLNTEHKEDIRAIHSIGTPRAFFFWVVGGFFVCILGIFYQNWTISDKVGNVHSRITQIDSGRVEENHSLKENMTAIKHAVESIDGRLKIVEQSLPQK